MPKINFTQQLGASLLEVMLAFSIVAFGLLGLANLQTVFFKDNANSRTYTAALNYAQQKIDYLRNFAAEPDPEQFLTKAELAEESSCDAVDQESLCRSLNTELKRNTTVSACSALLSCRWVTVEVTWFDLDGIAQQLSLQTYLAPYDPLKSGIVLAQ